MTIEADLYTALQGLVDGRVIPDVAPVGTERPYITFQSIPTRGINFLDQATVPSKKLRRFQISIWGETRKEVDALAIQVEDTLRAATTLQTTVENSPGATYDPETQLRGSNQDFSFIV